jgi:hypothetical protein
MRAISILCVAASALAGCAPSFGSEAIATSELTILLDALDEGSGAKVLIWITSNQGDVELTGADAMELTAADTVWPLKKVADDGHTKYLAEIGSVSGELVLDLTRRHEKSVHQIATMPPPFTLTVEGPSATEPLRMTWDAGTGDDVLSLEIAGECIHTLQRILANDTGSYKVARAELAHQGESAPAACPLTVKLTRQALAQTALVKQPEDGTFATSMTQRRTAAVDWQP